MGSSRSDSKKSKKSKKTKEERDQKLARKEEKKKRKEEKKRLKVVKKQLAEEKKQAEDKMKQQSVVEDNEEDCGPPIHLMTRGSRPETKAEYDKRQSFIRRVEDPETGRIRLIKGDGEILEEMVGREQHKKVNKQATEGDGRFFQKNTVGSTYNDN